MLQVVPLHLGPVWQLENIRAFPFNQEGFLMGGGHMAHRLAGDMVCSGAPWGTSVVAVCPSARDTCPLASVTVESPLHQVLPGLPAFFCRPCAVYIRPNG